jgi:hypothetical protein
MSWLSKAMIVLIRLFVAGFARVPEFPCPK